jgi:tetratricopeptide (TPR) repeat protein
MGERGIWYGAIWILVLLSCSSNAAFAEDCREAPYDCALFFVSKHDFPSAIRYLEKNLERSPQDLKTLNLLGIALTESGQIERANRQFRKALHIDPHFYPALKNLAINELTMRQTADAKTHFEQFLKHAPDDETTHISLAEIYFREKQCGLALRHYDKSRTRTVNNPELILHYSQCSLESGRQQSAIDILDLVSEDDAESQFQAGMMLGRAGEYLAAAKHFGVARRHYPDPYRAGYNQTLMQIRGGDFPDAIQTASELFSQGYRLPELYNLVSQAYLKNGQTQEAYDALRKATQLDPKDENNYIDLATICDSYSNYDLGIEITDIGLRHVANSYRLYLERGALRAGKGQLAQAEEDFAAAQKLAPQEPLPYVALGITWLTNGESQKAITMLRARATLTPDDFLTQYLLGQALIRSAPEAGSESEREAIFALETSIRLNPNFSSSRFELGKLLLRRGKVDQGIEQLDKAMALDPMNPGPPYQLARAYQKKGDADRAKELMARSNQLRARGLEDSDRMTMKRIIREGIPAFSTSRSNP